MTELIILERLKDLPKGVRLLQLSPIKESEALAWGEQNKARQVFYWRKTKSAFLPSFRIQEVKLKITKDRLKDGRTSQEVEKTAKGSTRSRRSGAALEIERATVG